MKRKFLILLSSLMISGLHLYAQDKTTVAVSHSLWVNGQETPVYTPPIQHWLSVRGIAEFRMSNVDDGIGLNYFAVLAMDSILYLHLSKFGIELGRALCTPDSLTVLIHTSQSYWSGTYSLLYSALGIPLDFRVLQELLLLSPELPEKSVDSSGYLTKTSWKSKDTSTLFTVDYAQYENVGKDSLTVYYPHKMLLRVPESDLEVRMQHRSVKVEVPGPSSLKIPDKYSRVKLFIK